MAAPKALMIPAKRLRRVSRKKFTAVPGLVAAEDQRRFTAALLRGGPIDGLTAQAARTESAKLRAEYSALTRQVDAIFRRQRELIARQHDLDLVILRAHV